MTAASFRRSLALVWRSLRSMRTALVLLLLLALGSVAGSLVPQVANSPQRVAAMFRDHPLRAAIYERLGLFDVFGSWWFTLIYTLLLLSLAACLIPRTRATFRHLRARPQPVRELDGFRHYAERVVRADPVAAVSACRRALRGRGYRVSPVNGEPVLAAEKGLGREVGSLLFHWSIFLLLVGVAWGKGTGFTGFAVIPEGSCWTEAHANYDGQIREGSFFGEDHSGVTVCVRDFEDTYRATGQPMDFVSRAEIVERPGGTRERVDIRVNHPASAGGVRFYQYGYGWAPVIEVRRDGELVASGPVTFQQDPAPRGVSQLALPWRGVLKLPGLRPQVGIEFDLWPDSRALVSFLQTGRPVPMLSRFQPVMLYTAYRGDLGLTVPQSSSVLDKRGLREWARGVIGAGQTVELATGEVVGKDGDGLRGLTVTFSDLRQYTVLQVGRDRALPVVLVAAILMLVALLPALYASRRRVWVRAERNGGGTVLKIGGFALQRKEAFEEEFAGLVERLERASQRGKVGSR